MIAAAPLVEQLTERLKSEDMVFITASLDEYWTLLDELGEEPFPLEYDIEYINGQIRARQGAETDNHEVLVLNLASILGKALHAKPTMRVMGSNKLVYIPTCELATKPDVLVMKGESQLFPLQRRAAGITNPYILIEVHSDSTQKNDLLQCYKQLDSVRHIIYIDQHRPNISVYTRQYDNRHWLNEDYDTLDMAVTLGDVTLSMQDIYHKVALTTTGDQNA